MEQADPVVAKPLPLPFVRVYDRTVKCAGLVSMRAGDGGPGTRPCRARAVNKTPYCRDHQPSPAPLPEKGTNADA